jgi:hypothetical protein
VCNVSCRGDTQTVVEVRDERLTVDKQCTYWNSEQQLALVNNETNCVCTIRYYLLVH